MPQKTDPFKFFSTPTMDQGKPQQKKSCCCRSASLREFNRKQSRDKEETLYDKVSRISLLIYLMLSAICFPSKFWNHINIK